MACTRSWMLRRNMIRLSDVTYWLSRMFMSPKYQAKRATPRHAADGNAVRAIVRDGKHCCCPWIIELRRAAFDDHIRSVAFAEIYAWLANRRSARGDWWNILQVEDRKPFGRRARHGRHHDARCHA